MLLAKVDVGAVSRAIDLALLYDGKAVTVRENFVACDVLSQLQRVMDNSRFLPPDECEPLSVRASVRIYARPVKRRLSFLGATE